jgi:Mrp family chromosome partitioning ATPase
VIFPMRWKYPYARSKQSQFYKDYEGLAARLLLDESPEKRRVTQITSAWDGEGKSYTTLNLAAHLAVRGKKVLIIEADSQRRTLSELFGFNYSAGLMSALSTPDEPVSVRAVPKVTGLSLLVYGDDTNVDSLELLRDRLAPFLQQVVQQYDFVLLDSAPLIPSDEAKVLVKVVQRVLLVVRGQRTTNSDIDYAREIIQKQGGDLLGFAMNAYHEYMPRAFRAWL